MVEENCNSSFCERLVKLEGVVQQQGEEIEGQGVTVDHLANTMDTIVMPRLDAYATSIANHESITKEAHDYIVSQRGAWQLIQRVGIVVAALASAVTLVMKLTRWTP